MRLNDNPYLRERDELLAHLVDDGSISAEAAQWERCERCDGSGWMIAEDWESGYHLRWKTQCAQCHGCGVAHLSEQEGGGDGG